MSHKSVDVIFPVTSITSFNEMHELVLEAASRIGELEWPEEFIGLLEVRANSVDLMNKILNANDAMFAKSILNNSVIIKSNPLFVHFSESTFVD